MTASLDKFPFKVANGGSCSLPFDPGNWMGGLFKACFFHGGGVTKKYKKGFCVFRNKAMRRPIMAPITSYSSFTATVSGFVGRRCSQV